ncbi:MAG: DoxX family protein [Rubrobacter sp.]
MSRLEKLRHYAPTALAALFATSGVLHLVRPETYTGLVPRILPAPEAIVYASGAAELILAAGLLARKRWSGPASAVFLVAIFPAHIQMLLDFQREYGPYSKETAIAWARMPFQLPMIWAALQINHDRDPRND